MKAIIRGGPMDGLQLDVSPDAHFIDFPNAMKGGKIRYERKGKVPYDFPAPSPNEDSNPLTREVKVWAWVYE